MPLIVDGMTLIHLTPDELAPAAESALAHRLIEHGDDPNEWNVLAVWESGDVYAVVLGGERVSTFTLAPEGEGYFVIEVTED